LAIEPWGPGSLEHSEWLNEPLRAGRLSGTPEQQLEWLTGQLMAGRISLEWFNEQIRARRIPLMPSAGPLTDREVVRLADEEKDIPADLTRIIAEGELEIHRGDLAIRQAAADRLLMIFAITNIAVLGFLFLVFAADVVLVATGSEPATARIIDRGVVKTLIGATVVQVGTLMVAMARYLFPRTERQGLFFRPPTQQRPGFFARLFGR
jgi:hypothetical protein